MANVKIGFQQIKQPAPRWWRRFERAYIVMVAPALAAHISGWGFQEDTTTKALLTLTLITSLVKGFGMFLGNGQVYADAPGEDTHVEPEPVQQ